MYDFILSSFVPVFAGGDHMVRPHISETALDTEKKFHICSSPIPLAMYMKFYKNRNTFWISGINGLICPLRIWLIFVLSHDWLLWFIIQSYSEVASRVFIIFVFVNHMQTDQGNHFISWMKMANCGRPLWIFIIHENLFHPGSKIIDLTSNK